MSRREKSIRVSEADWRDAIKIARILRHRTTSTEWRIRRIVSIAAYLLHEERQAEEIRRRIGQQP